MARAFILHLGLIPWSVLCRDGDNELSMEFQMDKQEYNIPKDFPLPTIHSSIAGHRPKLALTQCGGKFYLPGGTPPELFRRWKICEDLARQFADKSIECKAGKRIHMSEQEILDQYCVRAMKTGWGSDDEMRWVIRRTAEILGWPVPASALAPGEARLNCN